MIEYREICENDDAALACIVRTNLKAHGLDIPGTVYFDNNLDHLSDFYLGDKKQRYYCICHDGDMVVGGIGLAKFDYFENCAELQKLDLTDSVKGHGIGYTLIKLIEDKARELGFGRMYLETHTNLSAAIHIYERCGYEEIGKPEGVVHATMNKFYIKNL